MFTAIILVLACCLSAQTPANYSILKCPPGFAPAMNGNISEWGEAYFIDSLRSDDNIICRDNTFPWTRADFQYKVYAAHDDSKVYFALQLLADEGYQSGNGTGCDDAWKINPGGKATAFYLFHNGTVIVNPSCPFALGRSLFATVTPRTAGPVCTAEFSLDKFVLDPFGMGTFQMSVGMEEGDTPDCMDTHYGGIGIYYTGNKQDWNSSGWDNPMYYPTFSLVSGPAMPAVTLVPVQSPTLDRRPRLNWHPLDDTSAYVLEIDTGSAFTAPLAHVVVADTFFKPLADLPIHTIYWRVGTGFPPAYSPPGSFDIQDSIIPILYAFRGSTVTTQRPKFRWRPVKGATVYRVQIDTGKIFAVPKISIEVTDTTFTPLANLGVDTYYWRVSCDRDFSAFSQADSLRVTGVDAERGTALAPDLEILVHPNPVNSRAAILFFNPRRDASVTILDASGRVAGRFENLAGSSLEWNASNRPAGVYIIRVLADGKERIRRVCLIR